MKPQHYVALMFLGAALAHVAGSNLSYLETESNPDNIRNPKYDTVGYNIYVFMLTGGWSLFLFGIFNVYKVGRRSCDNGFKNSHKATFAPKTNGGSP